MFRAYPAALALALLAGCPKPAPPAASVDATARVEPPALVALIVIDQLPVRLLDLPKSRYQAGLARLTGPEAAVRTARFPYAITFTCPGHATISTGVAPSTSGIVSNDWWVPVDSTSVYCADASFLRTGTLADRVVDAGGKVASLALKDRSAIMLGGTRAQLTSWYQRGAKADAPGGPRAPGFTAPLEDVPVEGWMRAWEPLFPEDYAAWVGPDLNPLESDPGIGTTFPKPVPDGRTFLYTPFSGEALVDAALAATDRLQLGTGGQTDLLALSFSQTDYIGHAFTVESWEAMDGMVRLDAQLGRLLDGLEARVGAGRLTVLLTSDHGSFTASRVGRIAPRTVVETANQALQDAGFAGEVHFEDPSLWLPPEVRADPAARARAAVAVADAVRQMQGIGDAFAWRDAPVEGPHAQAVTLSLDDERSGDVYVMRGEHALYDYAGAPGQGTSHGTPFHEDTDVPFLAWGVGVQPGAGELVDMRQVAPTAAALLGVPAPAAATLPPVDSMLAR